ncbi:MAG TPA: hypothetical protein VHZ53_14095 [Steroidobacteraceae bacterium]|nr:hypothetical protein [Steroidobacteraceae bacterium]
MKVTSFGSSVRVRATPALTVDGLAAWPAAVIAQPIATAAPKDTIDSLFVMMLHPLRMARHDGATFGSLQPPRMGHPHAITSTAAR